MVLQLIFIGLLAPLAWANAGNLYTLSDLEILSQELNHTEFFDHALDIRPSERKDNWKAMVSKMADDLTRRILQKETIEKKDFRKIEDLFGWPVLKADDVFRSKRQQIGLSYLKNCLRQESPCWDEVRLFWEKDKADADTSFKLAELTLPLDSSPISTWSFLEIALKSSLSEFYCKKEFVLSALWGKIEVDYIRLGPLGDLTKKIDLTVHPDCLPSLISEARKRLYRPQRPIDRELSYQILKSQLKDDQETTDFFLTVYLLDNPSQGELLNFSWNKIKELGGTVERREKVLAKLKNLDPLPDGIFSTFDMTKKRVLLNHFKTYFPEYLNHYTDQCINFFSGSSRYPNGNPTIHCQDFMSSDLAPTIIDQFKINKYLEARKI